MRKSLFHTIIALGSVFSPIFFNGYSEAYNWDTHKSMVEVGIAAMLQTQNIPDANLPAPPGIDPGSWNDFLSHVRMTPGSLSKLRIGTLYRGDPDFIRPNSNNTCACEYDSGDNMSYVELYRIMDFHYIPNRAGGVCDLSAWDVNPSRVLGGVLGWHAAMVDDHLTDTVGWHRPFNSVVGAWYKDFYNKWWEYGVGALAGSVKCVWEWFHGRSCNVMHAGRNFAHETNVMRYIESILPGWGYFTSDDYTGLWHFMDPKAQFPTNFYNDVRGMYYPNAGPDGRGGIMDWLIIAASDATGMSLRAAESHGVDRYGQFDEVSRDLDADWQGQTFGHLEWSPLQNLGRYGWEVYQDNRMHAYGLGFPLHAIADAVQTQHIASTTSYGHRPLEDYINDHLSSLLPGYDKNPKKAIILEKDQFMRILSHGYQAWSQLKGGTSFKDFLISIGTDTRNFMDSAASMVYDDYGSYMYQFGAGGHYQADERYSGTLLPYMQPAIEEGIASMIGFLISAAELVIDPQYDPKVKCPPGTHYDFASGKCIAGSLVCNPAVPFPDGLASFGPTCQSVGQPCMVEIVAGVPLQCCEGSGLTCVSKKCVKEGEPSCQGYQEACTSDSDCCTNLGCFDSLCVPVIK
jgi:hypothetical protein